jgi:hypothetical protein
VRRWYVDTWFPFCNSSFLVRYWAATGGTIDASFEPFRIGLVLRSPTLLAHGLFGRASPPRKDVALFARRTAPAMTPVDAQKKGRGGPVSPAADVAMPRLATT